ncbi:hypothetical protein PPEP_b0967 [Pseudoalteromonas peptidolytica F12-50-A1]|uniref:Uncharacterized protein n=1 Tax=Pseudoalteromonas peptidolytica F12-50-A1 TaxID=1315280 RepID=A0A8I0T6F1_9GAMM|nr:hypothetical protein [Pseudoalteromonas peptidolytica F12-50-A1]
MIDTTDVAKRLAHLHDQAITREFSYIENKALGNRAFN